MLESTIESFITDALSWLAEQGAPASWTFGKVHELTEKSSRITRPQNPDVSALLAIGMHQHPACKKALANIAADPAYLAFREFVAQKPAFKLWGEIQIVAPWLVLDHIQTVPSLTPDAATVSLIAANFAKCVRERVFGQYIWSPLEGFSADIDEIDCGDGYVIRRFDPNEMLRLLRQSAQGFDFSPPLWSFALERRQVLTMDSHDNFPQSSRSSAVVKALRLLNSGEVAISRTRNLAYEPGYIRELGESYPGWRIPIRERNYMFPSGAEKELRALTDAIDADKYDKSVRIAIGRIASSVERPAKEDNFIDQIIALEAVFGDNTDGLPGGITFKIAYRMAMFMFSSPEDRRAAVSRVKDAMTLRGKLVHGASGAGSISSSDQATIAWIEEKARATVRRVILEYPDFTGKTVDEVIFAMVRPIPAA